MNSPLAQMRRIGLRLIDAVMVAEQLVLNCVNTMMAPQKVTNVLRCHVPISIRSFTIMSSLSLLRDTHLVLNMHLIPLGSTTKLGATQRGQYSSEADK